MTFLYEVQYIACRWSYCRTSTRQLLTRCKKRRMTGFGSRQTQNLASCISTAENTQNYRRSSNNYISRVRWGNPGSIVPFGAKHHGYTSILGVSLQFTSRYGWDRHWGILTLYCADRPKPPNPSYIQTVQNRPVNSQFMGLSFAVNWSFFYINQPAKTADLSSM